MQTTCPACGKKLGILDLVSQPPVCLSCEKSGAKAPAGVLKTEEAKTDVWTGRAITLGAIAMAAFVIFVPARPGASPGGKFYLLGLAFTILGIGLAKSATAKEWLRRKRK